MTTVQLVPTDEGRILRLVLARPERLNALSATELGALATFVHTAASTPTARALVVSGEGRAFCAGADLDYLRSIAARPLAERIAMLAPFTEAVTSLVRCPLPTVAAVQGAAFGAGVCVALACDTVLAADDARFGLIFTSLGLTGADSCAAWLLSRRVPTRVAWRVLADGAELTASEALTLGLVDRVVPAAELEDAALTVASARATRSALAMVATKRAVLALEHADELLDEQARFALADLAPAFDTPELRDRLGIGAA